MSRALNLTAPDIGAPDANRPEGFYLDESVSDPGTPILADNKNDIYTFFSRMMEYTGITFNNVVDQNDTSQFFEALRRIAAIPEKQTVSVSSTLALGPYDWEVEVDLSIGNISINQLPVPNFIGQKIHIYGVGSGIGYIAGGTGLYANGVYFTENTGGVFLTAVSMTEYKLYPGVTAKYVIVGQTIKQYADGSMENSSSVTVATFLNYVYSIAFISVIDISFKITNGASGLGYFAIVSSVSNTTAGLNTLTAVGGPSTRVCFVTTKGEY